MNWADDPSESACVTSCIVKNLLRLWEMHCIALYWFFYFGLSVLVSFLPCDRLGRLCWRSLMVFQHLFHYERLGFGFPVCASFGQQRVLNERLILKEVFFCCQAEHTIEEKSCTSYNREAYNRQEKTHQKPINNAYILKLLFHANLLCFMIKTFEFKTYQSCKWLLFLFSYQSILFQILDGIFCRNE